MNNTADIYGAMAEGYLHGRTTTLFRSVQCAAIRQYLAHARGAGIDKWYSEMKCLIVGPGPAGNIEEWINQATLRGSYLDQFDPRNMTYFDNSLVVLELCKKYVHRQVKDRVGKVEHGQFILGSGEEASRHFASESFDVVIAALCDHMEVDRFFPEAWKVLKPGGVFITSFPADGVNRIVREKLYHIPSDHTRFNIDGVPYLVPSRLIMPAELRSLYRQYGFRHEDAVSVSAGIIPATDTIVQAAALVGLNPQEAPLITLGSGQK